MMGDSSSEARGVMRYQSVLGVRKGDLSCERLNVWDIGKLEG